MPEQEQHEALVTAALRRLGREPAPDPHSIRILAEGGSGSSVYALDLAGERAVLKLTPPTAHRPLIEQARHEHRFYHDLAMQVPVLVPRVLGFDLNESDGAVMLLAAYEPSPPPDQWSLNDFASAARQLGHLHATYWGKAGIAALPEWLRAKPAVTPEACRDAATRWRALGERDDIRETLNPHLQKLGTLLLRIPALDPQMVTIPATLCHGDCHTGNLLQNSAGEWVWADWQGVRLGPGVDDLTFFWQRVLAATATPPPYGAMASAYRAGLEDVRGALLTEEELEHNLAWSELRSWLVDWPGYLEFLSAASAQGVEQRIAMLIERFAA